MMTRSKKCAPPVPALLLQGLLALVSGCAAEPSSVPKAEAAVATAAFRYGTAEAARHRPTTELTGSLDPVQSVRLGFDVPGRVQRLLVNRGDSVSAGQAIATLDTSIAQGQYEQAAAAVVGAEAQLTAGEANFARPRP